MTFSLEDHWVWDFWVADDGSDFHLFYLHAPKSLGDPELRHRHARIGHASSAELREWTDHGEVLAPGAPGSFDETATWTGSVLRGPDGMWRMFYTGASFASVDSSVNVQAIGVATSSDLHTWSRSESFVLRADGAHYEKLGDSDWREEAWRDPWVFPDAGGAGWHMLITARGRESGLTSGGVIGHAWSPDLVTWSVRPPLSVPATSFAHLEVLQLADVSGTAVLVFCASRRTTGTDHPVTGVWAVEYPGFPGPIDVESARLLASAPYYAGRVVHDRSGAPVLMAFLGSSGDEFAGIISDPLPLPPDALGS